MNIRDPRGVGEQVKSGLWLSAQLLIGGAIFYLLFAGWSGITSHGQMRLFTSCLFIAGGSGLFLAMAPIWRWMISAVPAVIVLLGVLKHVFALMTFPNSLTLAGLVIWAVCVLALSTRLRHCDVSWIDRLVLLTYITCVLMVMQDRSEIQDAGYLAGSIVVLALPTLWHRAERRNECESEI